MCNIEKFKLEDRELEDMLLKHFRKWKSHQCQYLKEDEMKGLDWIDEFCKDVRKNLIDFEDNGRLKEPLGSQ